MTTNLDGREPKSKKLIKTLLETCKGMEFDGIQAMRYFNETWGIHADHHVYTDLMDSMTRTGQAECSQGWGNTRYVIL